MKIKKGQLLELEISGIAFGGKGIAKINGLIVFVEKAVPMDHVVARIVKKKSSMQRLLSTPSLNRHPSG